jgi:hypothetical protein
VSEIPDIDWSAPAIDIIDELVELWFERHPEVTDIEGAFDRANLWAESLFEKHAQ